MARPAAPEERLATQGSPPYFNNEEDLANGSAHGPGAALLLLSDGEQGERLGVPTISREAPSDCSSWLARLLKT